MSDETSINNIERSRLLTGHRKSKKQNEKVKQEALKALRQELSQEIVDQLGMQEVVERPVSGKTSPTASKVRDEQDAKRIIEAILFTASKPVTVADLKRILGGLDDSAIETLVRSLKEEYDREGRSFQIQEIAGGFECASSGRYAPWIVKLERDRQVKHATQSALETLAILAYKQPVTRAEVEELRGVDVSAVLSALVAKHLIKVVGRKEVPGRPFLYGTTEKFLTHFGLNSLTDLPNLSDIQKLVENSVKREELLRTEKIVSQEGASPEDRQENDGRSGSSE